MSVASAASEPARTARGRSVLAYAGKLLPPLLVIVVLVVAWELTVRLGDVAAYLLPAPSSIARYMGSHGSLLWHGSVVTTEEILYAFGLSIGIGVPLGMLLAWDNVVSRAIYPIVVGTQTFPKLALGPLFIVWFGFGLTPKLILAFLVTFFPLTINTTLGIQSVREETRVLARSIGLDPAQRFVKIVLPQALPSIFSGLKVGITLAVVGAVVAEFLGATNGIGYLIITATGTVNTLLLFSALIALLVIGTLLYASIAVAERLAIPWWFHGGESR